MATASLRASARPTRPSQPAPDALPAWLDDPPTQYPLDPSRFAEAMSIMPLLTRYFRVRVRGVENLPEGAAMMVGNHGPFGMDATLLISAIYRETGRAVRGLADRMFFRNERARNILNMAGVEEASLRTAVMMLRSGQLVMTYPGGAREIMRPPEARYQLRWQGRMGSVRAAMLAGVPVVPVACIGIDDVFMQLRTQAQVAKTPLGRMFAKKVGKSFVAPLYVGLGLLMPLPAQVTFHIGKPIKLPYEPKDSLNPRLVAEAHAEVQRALEALIAEGLEERERHAGLFDLSLRALSHAIEERALKSAK